MPTTFPYQSLVLIARRMFRGVVILTLILGAGFGIAATRVWWRSRALEHADVDADVAASLQRADFRLVAIEGAGLAVPGISDSLYRLVVARPCTRVIYAGDAFRWDWDKRLHDIAVAYATAYNRRLVERVGAARLCVSEPG